MSGREQYPPEYDLPDPPTCAELFAGIGGFSLGLELAGFDVRWQVENDPYCQRVLEKHWPNATRYGDIRDVRTEDLEPVDIIAGGFPCQDISIAGNRTGITGARSGLWSEFARILRDVRPLYAIVENVPGIYVRGLGTVLRDLAEIGYDAEWEGILAYAVGAPHYRDRCWILAYADSRRRGSTEARQIRAGRNAAIGSDPKLADADNGRCEVLRRSIGSREQSPARFKPHRRYTHSRPEWNWSGEPAISRMANGVPNGSHRRRALGNALLPQIAEYIGLCIKADMEARI